MNYKKKILKFFRGRQQDLVFFVLFIIEIVFNRYVKKWKNLNYIYKKGNCE